jgi:hypothetical protein
MTPVGVSGPASSPTAESLRQVALDLDDDPQLRSFSLGALATLAGYEQVKTKSPKEPNYQWTIILILYFAIVLMAVVIFFSSTATADHKNQALGFLFGQAPLLLSSILKKKDKD